MNRQACTQIFIAGQGTNSWYAYYVTLTALVVWIPTLLMLASYSYIMNVLRKSTKAFPYLSNQSRIVRSRRKLIRMLFILMIVQLICWAPWQASVIVPFHNLNVSKWYFYDHYWYPKIQPILFNVKYYFTFANSALNPIIYGLGNENMQKAFRITFPFFFKGKVSCQYCAILFNQMIFYQL